MPTGRLAPSVRRMPGWKPIMFAPLIAVLAWFIAYWVADHRGAPRGDTNFFWMPLLPVAVGVAWFTAAWVICIVRLTTDDPRSKTSIAVMALAALANGVGVAVVYGVTFSNVGGDGWPDDPVALSILGMAAIVSLLPIAWLFVPRQERQRPHGPPAPRARRVSNDGLLTDWDEEDQPSSWW